MIVAIASARRKRGVAGRGRVSRFRANRPGRSANCWFGSIGEAVEAITSSGEPVFNFQAAHPPELVDIRGYNRCIDRTA
jgi:hypothetical protein